MRHENDIETLEEIDIEVDNIVDVEEMVPRSIYVFNDDVNTFEHVIWCLERYCEHTQSQAEQCALIIHNNGKCGVKNGDMKKLKPIKEALTEKGLDARIL